MKTLWKTLAVLLALALVFSLTAAAFADDAMEEQSAAEPVGEEAAAPVEEASAEAAPEGDFLLCGEGECLSAEEGELICAAGGTVFNNGATVYNNGGTVYNNRGVCYNNAGVCYNNEGTVYLNGGKAFNNAGTAYLNGGELTDRTLPVALPVEEESAEAAGEEAAEPAGEEAAEPVEEEAAEPVEEEAAEPAGEEAAEPAGEEAAEPAGEEAAEPAGEEPVGPLYVLSAPVFEPLTVGYRRSELPTAAAALENTGTEPIVVKAARINGVNATSFTVKYEKNVTVAPGETNDTAWVVSPRPFLHAREYEARLVLILEDGELIEVPFSLTVVKP